MYSLLLTLHIIVCMLVILVVLIQSGKGAGLNSVFGSGGGDALFSAPSGSMFIRKLTTGLAVAFFLTSLFLTYLSTRQGLRTVTRGMWNQMPQGQQGVPVPGQLPAEPPPPPSTQQKK